MNTTTCAVFAFANLADLLKEGRELKDSRILCPMIDGADLTGIDLTGCHVSDWRFYTEKQEESEALAFCKEQGIEVEVSPDVEGTDHFYRRILRNVVFRDANLKGVHLESLRFQDANFDGATFNPGPFLEDCTFERCSFRGAQMQGVKETRDMAGGGHHTFKDVDFEGANLRNAQFILQSGYKASFKKACLIEAELILWTGGVQVDLTGALATNLEIRYEPMPRPENWREGGQNRFTFEGAILREAEIDLTIFIPDGVSFKGTDLRRAKLRVSDYADFTGADLRGAELRLGSGGCFTGARLEGVSFMNVRGPLDGFRDAFKDSGTILPSRYTRDGEIVHEATMMD